MGGRHALPMGSAGRFRDSGGLRGDADEPKSHDAGKGRGIGCNTARLLAAVTGPCWLQQRCSCCRIPTRLLARVGLVYLPAQRVTDCDTAIADSEIVEP